jgi:hypothetical protein
MPKTDRVVFGATVDLETRTAGRRLRSRSSANRRRTCASDLDHLADRPGLVGKSEGDVVDVAVRRHTALEIVASLRWDSTGSRMPASRRCAGVQRDVTNTLDDFGAGRFRQFVGSRRALPGRPVRTLTSS